MRTFFLFSFLILQISSFGQTSTNSHSLRYFLGQSESFVRSYFSSCHYSKEGYAITIDCFDEIGNKETMMFSVRNGFVVGSHFIPEKAASGAGVFSLETKWLKDEGWVISEQSTDEYGNLFYTYLKNKMCVK